MTRAGQAGRTAAAAPRVHAKAKDTAGGAGSGSAEGQQAQAQQQQPELRSSSGSACGSDTDSGEAPGAARTAGSPNPELHGSGATTDATAPGAPAGDDDDAEEEEEEEEEPFAGDGAAAAAATTTTTGGKKVPWPEGTVACPRCHSENTKFCYYNNYCVKQPRYFCKECQRYWTAGGTLRNVPVGAGRRKNKHSAANAAANAAGGDAKGVEKPKALAVGKGMPRALSALIQPDLKRGAASGGSAGAAAGLASLADVTGAGRTLKASASSVSAPATKGRGSKAARKGGAAGKQAADSASQSTAPGQAVATPEFAGMVPPGVMPPGGVATNDYWTNVALWNYTLANAGGAAAAARHQQAQQMQAMQAGIAQAQQQLMPPPWQLAAQPPWAMPPQMQFINAGALPQSALPPGIPPGLQMPAGVPGHPSVAANPVALFRSVQLSHGGLPPPGGDAPGAAPPAGKDGGKAGGGSRKRMRTGESSGVE